MSRLLRGLPAQLLLVTILPLVIVLSALTLGSVYMHQRAMRQLVSERDMRAVMATAIMLENIVQRHPNGALDLTQAQFDALVNPTPDHRRVIAFLVNAPGQAIYHTDPDEVGQNFMSHGGVVEALRGEHGVTYQNDAADNNDEHVVSYASILTKTGRFGLIIEEPWTQVVDPLMQYSMAVPLILLPVLLLATLGLMLGMRRIVYPLQRLGRQAGLAKLGDVQALTHPVHGIDEITQLQKTLNDMAQQIESDRVRLRRYANAVTEAQEEERKRLARELHDDTIQNLIVLSQRIQSARLAAQKGTTMDVAKLDALRAEVLRMIEDVRRFSRALRPIYLEEAGLVASLERLACEANDLAHTAMPPGEVHLNVEGDVPRLKPEVELTLFRIAQEAINNALRHAQASRVNMMIALLPAGSVRLQVCDNGRGFKPATPNGAGLGLVSIQERAALIGAKATITSDAQAGTQVEVEVVTQL